MNSILDFNSSYERYASYPTQLIYRSSYGLALEANQAQLAAEVVRGLCMPPIHNSQDKRTDIVVRDLNPNQTKPAKRNLYNDVELQAWLEYQIGFDDITKQSSVPIVSALPRRDPVCRFIYLWGEASREMLKVTQQSLTRILTYHQVMPGYLEFLYCFGVSDKPRDLGYSGFREQTLLSKIPQGPVLPAMGRSGRGYQMCYSLKAPYLNNGWSVRPAAIHHQFDIIEGTSVWIVTKGDLELKKKIESLTAADGRPEDRSFDTVAECFRSSMAVHLLLAHWSTEGWRSRIKALEDEIDEISYEALDAPHAPDRYREKYTLDHIFKMQAKIDKTHEASMVMESNGDVLVAIKQYYAKLVKHKDFPSSSADQEDLNAFTAQVEEVICNTKMHVSRAKLLAQIAADRKDMITRRLDSQATESRESLTTSMYNLGVLSQTEAATMRVVTVLTMLYLPATFVSVSLSDFFRPQLAYYLQTFFSTDVVHYQNQGQNNNDSGNSSFNSTESSGETSFSVLAMERWIEVTLPLTLVTVLIAWWLYDRSKKRIQQITGIEGALPLHQKPLWKNEKV